ncbi:MAG: sulfatase [Verrucomicrobia bacterium]|nr:sulfatase [Verrucomicrobiota bacterium]
MNSSSLPLRRSFARLLVLVALVTSHFLPAADAPRWNLLFITADDMNADSVGWMGCKLGTTPNLDAFAATAHKFVNNHVTVPICQPGRSAFMTGRVPHRNGALGFQPITPGTPTLTSVLKAAGYFTGVIDKHVHMKPDAEFNWDLKLGGSGKNPLLFGEHVAQCLKAAADVGKPFFLNANITDPHRPFYASQQLEAQKAKKNQKAGLRAGEGKITPFKQEDITVPSFLEDLPDVRREVAQYYSSVRRFDASFGEVMKSLRAAGREADTAIVFLSDHGMSFPFSKATVYRNGTWVPVLVRWPGMGQPQRREELVSSVDIVPTLLEVLKQPPLAGVDGRSWLPLLRGETQPGRDFVITHVNTVSSGKSFPQRCVRTKDFSYQFHAWPNGASHFRVEAMNGITFGALAKAGETDARIKSRVEQLTIGKPEQFFDLRTDPDERVNLIADAKHTAEIARLKKLLLAHMEKTADPQLETFRKVVK